MAEEISLRAREGLVSCDMSLSDILDEGEDLECTASPEQVAAMDRLYQKDRESGGEEDTADEETKDLAGEGLTGSVGRGSAARRQAERGG